MADACRSGRVFIAGDAAHSHPPYGAYGVNTGLEDVRNLGWKLAAALAGLGGPRSPRLLRCRASPGVLLDGARFHREGHRRRPHLPGRLRPRARQGRLRARMAAAQLRRTLRGQRLRAQLRRLADRVGRPWRPSAARVGSHAFAARAGHHLAPQPLSSGRNVFDELGDGFTLLCSRRRRHVCRAFAPPPTSSTCR